MLSFVLAAAVTLGGAPAAQQSNQSGGAQARASATVTILRAERATETAEPGGMARRVTRRSDGSATINFD